MDITAFDSLMDELAKYLGLSGISKTADNQCLLEIGKISVGFRFLSASGNIMIFSVIGQIPDSGRESFYKMLLEANHALFKTAGATLSVYTPLDMVALQLMVGMCAVFYECQLVGFLVRNSPDDSVRFRNNPYFAGVCFQKITGIAYLLAHGCFK